MQAYVQRSDLNLAREIAPNGKELLGIVLFSKKFELKRELLYCQEMPDTMQLECFCSWNPSFFGEHTKAVTKYERPKMKRNAWQKCIFSFSGVSISLHLYNQDHLVFLQSDCIGKRCRKFSPSARASETELCNEAALHCSFLLVWCGSSSDLFEIPKHKKLRASGAVKIAKLCWHWLKYLQKDEMRWNGGRISNSLTLTKKVYQKLDSIF